MFTYVIWNEKYADAYHMSGMIECVGDFLYDDREEARKAGNKEAKKLSKVHEDDAEFYVEVIELVPAHPKKCNCERRKEDEE